MAKDKKTSVVDEVVLTNETPVEETVVDETPVVTEETPVEETVVDETPVVTEETVVDETPVVTEETVVDETPVEVLVVDETPVEGPALEPITEESYALTESKEFEIVVLGPRVCVYRKDGKTKTHLFLDRSQHKEVVNGDFTCLK